MEVVTKKRMQIFSGRGFPELAREVDQINSRFARIEQVKRFTILERALPPLLPFKPKPLMVLGVGLAAGREADPDLPNPATYRLDSDLVFPVEETMLPIAKRKLLRLVTDHGEA